MNLQCLSPLLVLTALTMQAFSLAAGAESQRDYINGTRIGGWIGNNALLVLPDRSAGSVAVGSSFGGTKLVDIGNVDYTLEYGGYKGKNSIDPAWQLMAHPDLSNWLISFMKNLGQKIDAQFPDVSKEVVVRVSQNGAISSDVIKVQQASPTQALPDWMESIELKLNINPHDPTKVQFLSLTVSKDAYKRLITPLYANKSASQN